MNVYIFNPQYVKLNTLNYLCKIFKVKSVYNLIQDEYVDTYISNLNYEVVFNIREEKVKDKETVWKQGVYCFLNTISNKNREIYDDVVDVTNSRWHPIYNIEHCGIINVLVLHDNHSPNFDDELHSLNINEDFVGYARNILMKYSNIGDTISNILVGLNINSFLIPIKGGSYRYSSINNRYDKKYYKWVRFLRESKDGRIFDPTLMYIIKSYRRDFLNNSKERINYRDLLNELLTEEGIKNRSQFQERYESFLEEKARRKEEEAQERAEAEDWADQLKDMRDEFNSIMDDSDAWGNID